MAADNTAEFQVSEDCRVVFDGLLGAERSCSLLYFS
jgi:hypothetical protein